MTKSELILRLAEKTPHLFHRDIERIVNTVFDSISEALENGNRVELRGFGAFSIKKRDSRIGRNPRTGASVKVDSKTVPFFKTGNQLRDKLNQEPISPDSPKPEKRPSNGEATKASKAPAKTVRAATKSR